MRHRKVKNLDERIDISAYNLNFNADKDKIREIFGTVLHTNYELYYISSQYNVEVDFRRDVKAIKPQYLKLIRLRY